MAYMVRRVRTASMNALLPLPKEGDMSEDEEGIVGAGEVVKDR